MNAYDYLLHSIKSTDEVEGDDCLVGLAGEKLMLWLKSPSDDCPVISEDFLCMLAQISEDPDNLYDMLLEIGLEEHTMKWFAEYEEEWVRCERELVDEQKYLDSIRYNP